MPAAPLAERLASAITAMRSTVARWRGPLILLSLVIFAVGGWLSVRNLGMGIGSIETGPLLAQLLLAPLSLLYAGTAMVLLARSAGITMPLGRATALSSWATLAEALPVPGGAMVRAGALVAAGTGLAQSSALVVMTAILWISLAALGCGITLLLHAVPAGWLLMLGGAAGSLLSLAWLARTGGFRLAGQIALHRVLGMALLAVRLHFAFLTLGVLVPLADTLPFALANIAGTAASIAPSGLGISETLAAAAAGTVNVAPGAAFLAVGLDRLICLAASAVLAFATASQREAAA